ncbi:MAG: hypothetical protein OS112_00425 [Methanoregula sp.]|nr:MAG: hypothetical protein OS112_00425 [Methanoregula sp.]
MTGDPAPVPVAQVPALIRHDDEEAVILMVTRMITHRNHRIAELLDQFEEGTSRMHRERMPRSIRKSSDELIGIADQIHGLAEDNGYDTRKMMVYLERRQKQGESEEGITGHHGQVCYIQ